MIDYGPPDELIEALRRANPVAVTTRRDLASADAILEDVLAQRPRRVRRRTVVVAIAILLVALLLAAFVIVRREHARLPLYVACYGAADLHAHVVVEGIDGDVAKTCAPWWANGVLGSGPVPHFDVCVLATGQRAAFPGESGTVCPRLDLPEAVGDDSVARFVAAIDRQVSAACLGPTDAERVIREQLARRGLKGWTILRSATAPFDAANPCASLSFDAPNRTITLVAEGPARPPTP